MSGFNNRPATSQSLLDNVIGGNLSGIFSTRPVAKYASGARCKLKINGKLVGFAFNVTWRVNTIYTEVNTIDDPLTNELVPTRLSVDGTISAMHIPGQSATAEMWQSDVLSFLFHQYIQIEVRDSQTDDLLFLTNKAVILTRQEDIRVDSLAQVTLQFKAIGWSDEKPPETSEKFDQPSNNNTDSGLPLNGSSNFQLPKFGGGGLGGGGFNF